MFFTNNSEAPSKPSPPATLARPSYLTVPPVLTSPPSSGCVPMSTFKKVVFPTPFPPTIPMRSPLSNSYAKLSRIFAENFSDAPVRCCWCCCWSCHRGNTAHTRRTTRHKRPCICKGSPLLSRDVLSCDLCRPTYAGCSVWVCGWCWGWLAALMVAISVNASTSDR